MTAQRTGRASDTGDALEHGLRDELRLGALQIARNSGAVDATVEPYEDWSGEPAVEVVLTYGGMPTSMDFEALAQLPLELRKIMLRHDDDRFVHVRHNELPKAPGHGGGPHRQKRVA